MKSFQVVFNIHVIISCIQGISIVFSLDTQKSVSHEKFKPRIIHNRGVHLFFVNQEPLQFKIPSEISDVSPGNTHVSSRDVYQNLMTCLDSSIDRLGQYGKTDSWGNQRKGINFAQNNLLDDLPPIETSEQYKELRRVKRDSNEEEKLNAVIKSTMIPQDCNKTRRSEMSKTYQDDDGFVSTVEKMIAIIDEQLKNKTKTILKRIARNYNPSVLPKTSPEVNASVISPEVNASIIFPEVNASAISPEVNASVISPEVNASVISPEVNESAISPEVNTSVISPEVNESAIFTERNASTISPKVNASVIFPEVNTTGHVELNVKNLSLGTLFNQNKTVIFNRTGSLMAINKELMHPNSTNDLRKLDYNDDKTSLHETEIKVKRSELTNLNDKIILNQSDSNGNATTQVNLNNKTALGEIKSAQDPYQMGITKSTGSNEKTTDNVLDLTEIKVSHEHSPNETIITSKNTTQYNFYPNDTTTINKFEFHKAEKVQEATRSKEFELNETTLFEFLAHKTTPNKYENAEPTAPYHIHSNTTTEFNNTSFDKMIIFHLDDAQNNSTLDKLNRNKSATLNPYKSTISFVKKDNTTTLNELSQYKTAMDQFKSETEKTNDKVNQDETIPLSRFVNETTSERKSDINKTITPKQDSTKIKPLVDSPRHATKTTILVEYKVDRGLHDTKTKYGENLFEMKSERDDFEYDDLMDNWAESIQQPGNSMTDGMTGRRKPRVKHHTLNRFTDLLILLLMGVFLYTVFRMRGHFNECSRFRRIPTARSSFRFGSIPLRDVFRTTTRRNVNNLHGHVNNTDTTTRI